MVLGGGVVGCPASSIHRIAEKSCYRKPRCQREQDSEWSRKRDLLLTPAPGIMAVPYSCHGPSTRRTTTTTKPPVPSMPLARADVWENLLRTPGLEAPYRTLDLGAYPYPRTIGAEGGVLYPLEGGANLSPLFTRLPSCIG